MMSESEGQLLGVQSPNIANPRVLQWVRDYIGGAALTDRFKSAFQVALAMVITYGISMGMDWDKAFWAALSVIFCSFATAGESINACIDRIIGTVAAAILALLLVALFPQNRWLFLVGLSVIIAVCSYCMTGPTLRGKVWFNVGFNLPIIALLGESSTGLSPATFEMAMLRAQQTAMGAIVYSLVAILVWPRRGDQAFIDTVRRLCATQHELLRTLYSLLSGQAGGGKASELAAAVAGQLPTLGAALEGAAHDSPDIKRMQAAWADHLHNIRDLHSALERWGDGFDELRGLEVKRYIPAWDAFMQEMELGFCGIDELLSGETAVKMPQPPALPLDETALADLSHLQRASVVCCRDRLLAVGGLVVLLFESAHRIASEEPAETVQHAPRPTRQPWVIDLDRLGTSIRQSSALWLTILAIMYIEGMPIPVALIALSNAFGMALGSLPQAPAIILYRPVILGGMLGGAFYMLVLPQLSQFWQFGLCLFALTFAIAYIFHEPKAALTRGLFMTMIVLIMLADNTTNYNFLQFANWMMVGVTFVTLMAIAWRFPISFRAEDRLQAQLRRYWNSAAFQLRDLDTRGRTGFADRWKRAFHAHQLESLPLRLSAWAATLPPAAISDSDRQQLKLLLQNLRLLSQRMSDLASAYSESGKRDGDGQFYARGEAVRLRMATLAEQISQDPAAFSRDYRPQDLQQARARLQDWVEKKLDTTAIARPEAQRVYTFLGLNRAVLAAFDGAAGAIAHINWQRLGEARF